MRSDPYKIGIVGATGYTGAELVRLLHAHPMMEVAIVTSTRHPGSRLQELCPWLQTDLVLTSFEPKDGKEVDLWFLCQDVASSFACVDALGSMARIVDLSPAYRLKQGARFEAIYKSAWKGAAVFGLPELDGDHQIDESNLVANPGCHATAAILALWPLVQAEVIDGIPVIDSKTGLSGAGRSHADTHSLFAERFGDFQGYAEVGHRHIAEIEEQLDLKVRFTPHLLPVSRGLEVTAHVPLKGNHDGNSLRHLYQNAYKNAPFIRVDTPVSTKQVLGSNRCDISVTWDGNIHFAVVHAALDNLVKGASGQAIQNGNLMLGLPETMGLPIHGVWP